MGAQQEDPLVVNKVIGAWTSSSMSGTAVDFWAPVLLAHILACRAHYVRIGPSSCVRYSISLTRSSQMICVSQCLSAWRLPSRKVIGRQLSLSIRSFRRSHQPRRLLRSLKVSESDPAASDEASCWPSILTGAREAVLQKLAACTRLGLVVSFLPSPFPPRRAPWAPTTRNSRLS